MFIKPYKFLIEKRDYLFRKRDYFYQKFKRFYKHRTNVREFWTNTDLLANTFNINIQA